MDSTSRESSIDSCIILRLIRRDNPDQCMQARNLLINGRDYYVDDIVIMETVYVLTRDKMPRDEIIDRLRTILGNPGLNYDYRFFDSVFERFIECPSLSFDDCVLEARIAMKRKEPLWTLDRKFANQSPVARLIPTN